jgi:hypothetical protein
VAAAVGLIGNLVEIGIEVAMEAIDCGMIVLHRARPEDMVGPTTTKAAAKVGWKVANRDAGSGGHGR